MKKQLIMPFSLLAAVLILSLLSLSGCDPLEIQGTPITNISARIYWAGIPSDSMVHSFNPMLHWYGNDEDGQINDYIYGIFQGAYMDSASRENSLVIPDTMAWISLGNVTEAVIPLVASPDSSDTIGQYLVLRGIDDSGDTSNVINRYLYRTNNRPTCIVTVPQGPQWVLPDTTGTWQGINISWEGKDSLDYLTFQPDFLWEVRIYGPYDSAAVNDTLTYPDTSGAMFIRNITNDCNCDDSTRISATSVNFVDLRTGYYIIYVRNFDDANVPSVPALGVLEVYEPHWIPHPEEAKHILIADHSRYYPLTPMNQSRWGELPPEYKDGVDNFYIDMVENAGFTSNDYDWFDTHADTITVTKANLFNYRMVIVLDTDWNLMIPEDQQAEYSEYLTVGGKIWVIGRRSFETTSGSGRSDYPMSTNELAYVYMNLEASVLNRVVDRDVVEFNGANSLIASLPALEIDTLRVSYTSWVLNDYSVALFGIGSLIRFGDAETVYTFNSIDPDNSTYHEFPVAVRYDAGTFKTSYFAFPLYFMDEEASFQAADAMLSWFLDE